MGANVSAHFNIFQLVFQFFPLIFNTKTGASFSCHQVSFPAPRIRGKVAIGPDIPSTELLQTLNEGSQRNSDFPRFPSQQRLWLPTLSHYWSAQDSDVSVLTKNVVKSFTFFPAPSKPQVCGNPPLPPPLPKLGWHYPLGFSSLNLLSFHSSYVEHTGKKHCNCN